MNQSFTNNSSYPPVLYLIANFTGYIGSSFLDFQGPGGDLHRLTSQP